MSGGSNKTGEGECGLYYLNMNREVRERLNKGKWQRAKLPICEKSQRKE